MSSGLPSSARSLNKLDPSQDYEWRLEPQRGLGPRTCWRCDQLAVWDLTHYTTERGRQPRHRWAHEHYCHEHAIDRGLDPINDPHIRRVREHPWRIDEEVGA